MIEYLKKFFRENKLISSLLIISLLIVGFRTFDLNYWKLFFPTVNDMYYKFFDGFFWLAISYLPSFIMYLLVVEIPRKNDRRKILPFVASKTSMLVGDAQFILDSMQKTLNLEVKSSMTKEDIEDVCKKIPPHSNAPLLKNSSALIYADWIELFSSQRERSQNTAEIIFRYLPYLDSEHIRLVTRIDDCIFFSFTKSLTGQKIPNSDLGFLADSLFTYYELSLELKTYLEKSLNGLAWSERRS